MEKSYSPLDILGLSGALADAVESAGAWTVTVRSGNKYPSSGVLYGNGRIITAAHDLEDDAGMQIIDSGGDSRDATLRGVQRGYDLALLEVANPDDSSGARMSERTDEVRTGELVLAVGRPSVDGVQSSLGVVNVASGTYRPWHGPGIEGVMRSDASRFPGFSGGPLIDVSGAFVGLNVFGDRRRTSLTLPAKLISELVVSIEEGKTNDMGYLGIRSQPAAIPAPAAADLGREEGLLVVGTESDGPAEHAGILVGDIIVGVGGIEVRDHESLLDILGNRELGQGTEVSIVRGGDVQTVTVDVGRRPVESNGFGHRRRHRR